MSGTTGIEWTDATWNPIRGCSRVSEGCRNCYAEKQAFRFSGPGQPYEGLVRETFYQIGEPKKRWPQWNGEIKFVEEHLLDPLTWKKPRRIFVNSMSDLFHEKVTDAMLDRIFAVLALSPQHTFQALTKRPERMLKYLSQGPFNGYSGGRTTAMRDALLGITIPRQIVDYHTPLGRLTEPLPNVWLGVSVENQKAADERIPLLLQTPAAVRFLSVEPLLGPLDIRKFLYGHEEAGTAGNCVGWTPPVDWVICGGESGPGARPMHPEWARGLRDQCVAAGVPFFFKQWGEWKKYIDRDTEDPDWRQDYTNINSSKTFRFLNLAGGSGFHGERLHVMQRIGKKAAGRLLDGREWSEFPEVRA